jgi:hypothetical protein
VTVQIHASRSVPRTTPDSEPALTVLSVLADGWTWRTDPNDQQLSDANTDEHAGELIDRQLIRAFAWARILIS